MSRAYKQKLIDNALDLGAVGVAADAESMSGADLAAVLLSAENGTAPVVGTGGVYDLNTNASFGVDGAELTGADQERFAGDQ